MMALSVPAFAQQAFVPEGEYNDDLPDMEYLPKDQWEVIPDYPVTHQCWMDISVGKKH
jgi:hypothetical protein